jgi:hypothetical protein
VAGGQLVAVRAVTLDDALQAAQAANGRPAGSSNKMVLDVQKPVSSGRVMLASNKLVP